MTIRSYLVLTRPGDLEGVAARLRLLPDCDVLPAENRDVLIVVGETNADEHHEALEERLAAVDGVAGVSLVAGFADV